ncbi:hypothetical protein ACFQ9X_05360 [Catenulispora yoronensis]
MNTKLATARSRSAGRRMRRGSGGSSMTGVRPGGGTEAPGELGEPGLPGGPGVPGGPGGPGGPGSSESRDRPGLDRRGRVGSGPAASRFAVSRPDASGRLRTRPPVRKTRARAGRRPA